MIEPQLIGRIESALGQRVCTHSAVSGGDINEAYELRLADGQSVFLKTHARAPATMFAAEAQGLEFLREARVLRIPRVLSYSLPSDERAFLLLEFLRAAKPRRGFDEHLGRGLADLHRFGAPGFGFQESNFIGRLVQRNQLCATWAEFYREERLEPQLRAAEAAGRASLSLGRAFDRLFSKMPELVGAPEPPARLHGDLWSGNLHVDEHGEPCLIDPAVYGGHREMDLAMMRLFGGFSERVFAAYAEVYPLSDGAAERVQLCQLYPLLVHLNLFGGSYLGRVERALAAYV